MFYVYILESIRDKSWYIGYTKDPNRRIREHNNGNSTYTSKKRPWQFIYLEAYLNKADALGREKFLKSGAGRRFLDKQLKNYLAICKSNHQTKTTS